MSTTISFNSTAIQNSDIDLSGNADSDYATFDSMTNIDDANGLQFVFNLNKRDSKNNEVISVTAKAASFSVSKSLRIYDDNDRVSIDDKSLNFTASHKKNIIENLSSDGWWGYYATYDNYGNFKKYEIANLSYSNLGTSIFNEESIINQLNNSSERGGILDNKGTSIDPVTLGLHFNLIGNDGTNYGSIKIYIDGYENSGQDYFLSKIRSINSISLSANAASSSSDTSNIGTVSLTPTTITVEKKETEVTTTELIGYEDLNKGIHTGPDADMMEKLGIDYKCISNFSIGIDKIDVLTEKSAMEAMDLIDEAAKIVVEQRSVFGAYQNRLEHTIKNLGNVSENTTAAESRIRDTDMAGEIVKLSKDKILAQAGEAMLSQANTSQESVMNLLQ
ncbi:MAG: hypothetical protein K6E79_09165 [Pseudobutyrivibrio sp.]|nr:hypothetical protein [Pseudobutyrivibrio sp.]